MRLVELIAMFETFSKHCVFKDKTRDLMDEVTSIKLDLNNDDDNNYLSVYCKNHTYKHKIPKISEESLKCIKEKITKIPKISEGFLKYIKEKITKIYENLSDD